MGNKYSIFAEPVSALESMSLEEAKEQSIKGPLVLVVDSPSQAPFCPGMETLESQFKFGKKVVLG